MLPCIFQPAFTGKNRVKIVRVMAAANARVRTKAANDRVFIGLF